MHKLLSLLVLTALLLSSVGTALAQDEPQPTPDALPNIFLPLLSSNADELGVPEQPAPTPAPGQPSPTDDKNHRVTPAERREAAARNRALGLLPGAAGAKDHPTIMQQAGGEILPVPHYFGPYANYANSPMPKGSLLEIIVEDPGADYTDPTLTVYDVYGTGGGATATATLDQYGGIESVQLTNPGADYTAPIIQVTDATGADAIITPVLDPATLTGGIRKFVDSLPGLGPDGANNLGNYITLGAADTTTFPGTDYYEVELVQFTQTVHSDLPPTTFRGYRQANSADPTVNMASYLGPVIIAQRDRAVRFKFVNKLPTGAEGDLFIPVDTTVMGAGEGPLDIPGQPGVREFYTQNRATPHMHGALVPWVSDGTPHQWITPAGETTSYPKGASVTYIPDMWWDPVTHQHVDAGTDGATNNPGPGALTMYYNNQQSARLLFYHEHAWGITRLGVYAGAASAMLITDQVEADMIDGTDVSGVNPTGAKVLPGLGIPLIIQDKTFVDATTILSQDPNWRWGTGAIDPQTGFRAPVTGDLWLPNVYMPAQNPWDLSGASAFGRWQYGPWFWPPTENIINGPVANEYYDPNCESWVTWCDPPERPQMPNPSMGMEAYMDVLMVNGAVYPFLELQPKAYRFRILNAANDRFFNLQMYVADPAVTTGDGRQNTEVKMVPAVKTPGFPAKWSTDGREGGVPDPATAGPKWIQIGTEGGFLPAPVVVPNQPINWNTNATAFNVGNVTDHSLLIGNAERADVVVDFSAFRGKTIILYNDAPAAFPALDPRYDYYTGAPDQTETGGAPTPQAGFGPNTRTVMQFRIADVAPDPTYDLNLLKAVFAKTANKRGVFEVSQDPPIIPQAVYNSAYNATFPGDIRAYVRISDRAKSFTPVGATDPVTITFEEKAIHDEMGAAYDNEWGRMSGMLGLELPGTNNLNQNIILYGYESPPVELLQDATAQPMGSAKDGTQIWKITHNGVDTHPVHVHLFNVQIINRVGWDGAMLVPDTNEIGWKETFRVNPLESTIIALRPVAPTQPFDVPNSVRLIDPSAPEGEELMGPPGGFKDPALNGVIVTNHKVNYGWEYVWHCHILSHEEMDMMHSMAFAVTPRVPISLTGVIVAGEAILTWTDTSANETSFFIQRATDAAFTTGQITFTVGADVTTYTDTSIGNTPKLFYRLVAQNLIGDDTDYGPTSIGFPTIAVSSDPSTVITLTQPPLAPTNLVATPVMASRVDLTWTDNAINETGYRVERATVTGGITGTFASIATLGVDANSYNDTSTTATTSYAYRVYAFNVDVDSDASNIASATTPLPGPSAPTNLTATVQSATQVDLAWVDNASDELGFRVERATVTGGITGTFDFSATVAANVMSYSDVAATQNTTYAYRVFAFNGDGDSLPSNIASALTPPLGPTNLAAVANAPAEVVLNWTDNAVNETANRVERATVTGGVTGTFTTLTSLGADVIVYTDTTTAENIVYAYRVFAVSGALDSLPSNVAAAQTPPVAPTNLGATAKSAIQVDLTWTDNSVGETGYRVERALVTAGVTGVFSTVATLAADATAHSDTSAAQSTDYAYRVLAFNAAKDSAPSNEAPATTFPAEPTSLAGTAPTGTRVDLTWVDNATAETGYRVQRAPVVGGVPGAYATIATLAAGSAAYSDLTTVANTAYAYRVFAFAGAIDSLASNVALITTPPPPPNAPSNLVGTLQTGPRVSLTFRDNATTETGFIIQRSTNSGPFVQIGTAAARTGTGNVTYADLTVAVNNAYVYRVAATNGGGTSAFSNQATVNILLPTAPSNVAVAGVVSGAAARMTVTWTDNSNNETGFRIQRANDANFTVGLATSTVAANVRTFAENRTRGSILYYRVQAYNANGASAWVNATPFPVTAP